MLVRAQRDHANRTALYAGEGTPDYRAQTAKFCSLLKFIFGVCLNIRDLDGPPFEHHTAGDRTSARRNGMPRHEFIEFLRITGSSRPVTMSRRFGEFIAAISASHSLAAVFDKRIEHGVQIKRRTADDFEHVSGGRLLLQ